MDDDDKSMRTQREAASWNASPLMIPGIILAVILLMAGSTIMSKMTPPPTPTPTAAPATPAAAPGAAATRQMGQGRGMDKMNDPAFITKYQEKSKKFKGDFTKLTPAEQKEVNEATQGHGSQFFEMVGKEKR